MDIGMKVKVLYSPFSQVKKGEVGEIVSVKRPNGRTELAEVRFKNELTWHFWPNELEVLPPEEGGEGVNDGNR